MKSLTRRDRIVLSFVLSLATFVGLFMALQFSYYERYIPVEPFVKPEVTTVEEELLIDQQDVSIVNGNDEVRSLTRDLNDSRTSSSTEYNQNDAAGDPYERAKAYEQSLFDEAGGVVERDKIKREMDQRKQNQPHKTDASAAKGNHGSGGDQQFSGDVMVEFRLDGRTAYDNNLWHVRNPGYTCGYGSTGKVVVSIKVDKGGKVVEAQYEASKSSGANQCMIEQSVRYAKKSKFNVKDSAPVQQSGFIIYKFVAQ